MSRNEITLQEMFSLVIGELREGGRWGTALYINYVITFHFGNFYIEIRLFIEFYEIAITSKG